MTPLRELRMALGLTQQGFAEKTGIHQSQVSAHERTGQGIGRPGLLRLAEMFRPEMNRLGTTVEDLIRGNRDHTVNPASPYTPSGANGNTRSSGKRED